MMSEKGSLILTISNLKTGQILKRKAYEYEDVLDVRCATDKNESGRGDGRRYMTSGIKAGAKFTIETTIRDKDGNIKEHTIEEGVTEEAEEKAKKK